MKLPKRKDEHHVICLFMKKTFNVTNWVLINFPIDEFAKNTFQNSHNG